MTDVDRDALADGVRLTYSQRIRHRVDRDGKYPFAVSGYRIRSVGAASGTRTLVVLLVEKAQPDPTARPALRYRRTRSRPVMGLTKVEAAAQVFRATRPHGFTPPGVPPPPAPPTVLDADGDGTVDSQDCAPQNKAVHPGASDLPDLAFVDANCDGIDGTEKNAIFASPKGNDANSGTKQKPKRQIQAAVQAAAGKGKYVLAAGGEYMHVTAASGVAIYGGYNADRWSRGSERTDIGGTPEGVFADGAKNVTLQLLRVNGGLANGSPANGASVYGIRAVNNSSLRLQQVAVFALDAAPGAPAADGIAGGLGGDGAAGARGACDSSITARGGPGGDSPAGRFGGNGGDGKYEQRGSDGGIGFIGTPGGKGGREAGAIGDGFLAGGENGHVGSNGSSGRAGAGGANATALASTGWQGQNGIVGSAGGPGNGGGGGGAGGGQDSVLAYNGTGNAGGGGGGGGEGGGGGLGGAAGGGSFGVYLHNSSLVVEGSSVVSAKGGAGGRGGNGGAGGAGGRGGLGPSYCVDEVGEGGNGGRGGTGGQGGGGGGGAGGPSIGIFKAGTSTATVENSQVQAGSAGAGGATGAPGSIFANPLAAQSGIAQAIYP
jgi:hypothetical protein